MPSKELQAARDAAEAAAVVIRSMYQKNLQVTTKADATPVTEADVQAEEAIKAVLTKRFPSYGFYGEETGQHALDAGDLRCGPRFGIGEPPQRQPLLAQPRQPDVHPATYPLTLVDVWISQVAAQRSSLRGTTDHCVWAESDGTAANQD